MADEGNESREGRMDLNLYLGLPRSPRPRSSDLDLGSDLALSSLPVSTSSTAEEMSTAREPAYSHAPYSPSHASFTPEPTIPVLDPLDGNSNQEYTPYSPSYEPYTQSPATMTELEQLNNRYSPSPNFCPLPTLHENEEIEEPQEPHVSFNPSYAPSSSPYYIPLDPQETNNDPITAAPLHMVSPLITPSVPSVPSNVSMHAPRMPHYVPRSPSPLYSSRSPSYVPSQDDESSSRRLFDSPEYRLRTLIESSRRLRLRRYRSSLPYHGRQSSDFDRSASPVPELGRDVMSPQRPLETNGKHKVPAEGVATESLEENQEEKTRAAANFECNICFEMAQDPVVTSCGHLFCWPCLYQWLHVHSEHKECPVCKGEVTEANITPIYGRGSSEAPDVKNLGGNGEFNLKVPPRPRGNRFESFRQQFRPISRRFREGLSTSWRRLMSQHLRSRSRLDASGDSSLFGTFNEEFLRSLRTTGLVSGEQNAGFGLGSEEVRVPLDSTAGSQDSNSNQFNEGAEPPHPSGENRILDLHDRMDIWHPQSIGTHIQRDGIDSWHPARDITTTSRSTSITTNPLLAEQDDELWHRLNAYGLYRGTDDGGGARNGNRYGASTSSGVPPNPEHLISRTNVASTADQVSGSSTIAVIQGDNGLMEGSADPNSAGSSGSYRRRGRSSASGSLDVDGVLHARKRRRLN